MLYANKVRSKALIQHKKAFQTPKQMQHKNLLGQAKLANVALQSARVKKQLKKQLKKHVGNIMHIPEVRRFVPTRKRLYQTHRQKPKE